MKLLVVWHVIKMAALDWMRDRAPRMGAAISYYAIFSIAPVLVIAISIAGTVFGESQAKGEVFAQVNRFLGNEAAARAVEELVKSAARPRSGNLATTLSIVALWFGASGLFTQLKAALNDVWEVERKPHAGLIAMLIEYVWSVAMVLAVGLLLLFSLVVSSVITAVSAQAEGALPIPDNALQAIDWAISIVFLTVLFAAIFKFLPDVIITWRDVWVGAVVTSVLFTMGKFLIGFYLARSAIASAYGAAGSFILLLVWTYYSTQIVLFGAEITQAYARQTGSPVFPKERAQFVASAVKPDRQPTKQSGRSAPRSKSA
ncbi:MAG: YihY/virulence factor BrkB family protein [Planctomycetia bacterium]|nr:YihY/virulence factor BrkB family protein [Planctomycetia bacterium]